MNHPNKQELTKKIQKIKEITKSLEDLYHERGNQEAYNISHLLALMTSLFEEVDQRLKALEKAETEFSEWDQAEKSKKTKN